MKPNAMLSTVLTLTLAITLPACGVADGGKEGGDSAAKDQVKKVSVPEKPTPSPRKIVKSEAEWRELLTPEQFAVTRKAGTERPWGKAYENFKHQGSGTYFCVGCGAELFTSTQKFDSACGWPSFYDPSKKHNVKEIKDVSAGMVRIEVQCATCDAHLGHVFTGEGFDTPTDKRYCVNATALKFVEAKEKKVEKVNKPSDAPTSVSAKNSASGEKPGKTRN